MGWWRWLVVLSSLFVLGPVLVTGAGCTDYGLSDCIEKGVVSGALKVDIGDVIAYYQGNISGAPVSPSGWESVVVAGQTKLQPQDVWSISAGGQEILFTGTATLNVSAMSPGTYVLFIWGCDPVGEVPTNCRWLKPRVFTVADTVETPRCDDAGGFCSTGSECRAFGGKQLETATCDYAAVDYCCTLQETHDLAEEKSCNSADGFCTTGSECRNFGGSVIDASCESGVAGDACCRISGAEPQRCSDVGGFCTTGSECRNFGGDVVSASCSRTPGGDACCQTGSGEVSEPVSCSDAGGVCTRRSSCAAADRISRATCPRLGGVSPVCCDIEVSEPERKPLMLSVEHEVHESIGVDQVCMPYVGCHGVDQDEITIQYTADNPQDRGRDIAFVLKDENGDLVSRTPEDGWQRISAGGTRVETYTTKWGADGLSSFDNGYVVELWTRQEGVVTVVEKLGGQVADDAARVRTVCATNSDCSGDQICSSAISRCVQPVSCRNLQRTGPPGEQLDIVFIGDNYYFMDNLRIAVNKLVTPATNNNVRGLFSVEPFASNQDRINIWFMRAENKIPYTQDLAEELIQQAYSGEYNRPEALSAGLISATHCPWADVSVVISRNRDYRPYAYVGGRIGFVPVGERVDGDCSGYRWGKCDGRTLLHEFGHAFGVLADEYTEQGKASRARYPNCAENRDQAEQWWGDLLGLRSEVGLFNGCSYTDNNIRPTENSIMRQQWDLDTGWGPVNERHLREKLEQYGGGD